MVLLHSNYPDIESNQLNKAKNRVFKSAVTQYTKVGDIQSNIQPTTAQMKKYFSQITLFLKQILNSYKIIYTPITTYNVNFPRIIHEDDFEDSTQGINFDYTTISEKISVDYAPKIIDFQHLFELEIYPVYNYFNPQQNQIIKDLLEQVVQGGIIIINTITDEPLQNYIQTVNEAIQQLIQATDSYSPLKITLRKGRQLMTNDIEGGYISGGIRSSRNKGMKYPEIRFR
jgi:hypothetical protein